jgi:hypothetical protein
MPTPATLLSSMLSFPGERHRAAISDTPIVTERRSKSRYLMDLGIRFRFRLRSGAFLLDGVGRTVNVSSGGLLVVSRDLVSSEFREGGYVEFSIEWPVLLDGRIPLQLLGVGRVVRRGAVDFAATFVTNQFRTRRSSRECKVSRRSNDVKPNSRRELGI